MLSTRLQAHRISVIIILKINIFILYSFMKIQIPLLRMGVGY